MQQQQLVTIEPSRGATEGGEYVKLISAGLFTRGTTLHLHVERTGQCDKINDIYYSSEDVMFMRTPPHDTAEKTTIRFCTSPQDGIVGDVEFWYVYSEERKMLIALKQKVTNMAACAQLPEEQRVAWGRIAAAVIDMLGNLRTLQSSNTLNAALNSIKAEIEALMRQTSAR